MCLSVPSRVIEIKEDNTAVVEVFGARRLISLDLLQEEIGVGDWLLVESCVVYGDRGYRGCEGVIVCGSREMRTKRQVVEGVLSQIKLFNAGSGWRTLTCVFVYVYAYAIGYSYYRRGELEV